MQGISFADDLATTSVNNKESQPVPLPEPLTLDFALSLVEKTHPAVQYQDSLVQAATAQLAISDSENDTQVWLEGELAYAEPLTNVRTEEDDHRLSLIVGKTLYDFGRSSARQDAAGSLIKSQQQLYFLTLRQQKLEIMKKYFQVVLTDLDFSRYNEKMAVAYISLDKLRNRYELKQISELELLEQEAEYQKVRRLRFNAENQQRITRARLAYALNHPGQLPATVSRPEKLSHLERQLPELETLQDKAIQQNEALHSLQAEIESVRRELASVRAETNPLLTGTGKLNSYSQEKSSYDRWRLELSLKVPLITGRHVDSRAAKKRAMLYQLQAELMAKQQQIRQQILELWLKLQNLKLQQDEMFSQSDYRELYLDRSRALYELEVKTDIGDAMVKVTQAEREKLETDFDIVLTWEQIDILTGRQTIKEVQP
ncbi:MAG: TolC family protein [Gammaproteobacteria bacterium]|nr:TolC family protein [Gammaproteobacteria bacterium]